MRICASSWTRLARYKIPRIFEVRDTLPRTATGKLLKHMLRAARPAIECEGTVARPLRTGSAPHVLGMRRFPFGPTILVPRPGNTDDMDGSLQSAISSDMQLNHDLLTERPARQVSSREPPISVIWADIGAWTAAACNGASCTAPPIWRI
jgi:hypothetical protein